MAEPLECPGREYWQSVLEGSVPEFDQETFEGHLSSCATCQAYFDAAMAQDTRVVPLCRQYGDPTRAPADSKLTQIVEKLSRVTSVTGGKCPEPLDLYFLRPADQPGLLGILGPYEVHEVIGQGGMGVVLKAYEPALHRLVAIKVLAPSLAGSPTARRRFTREAQAAAAVVHDHIVTVHGVHETDGLPYLVMQYVPGESLQERLDLAGPLEVTDTVRIGLQTASGLAAAHAQGLVHRDIKPANLLLEDGLARVRITDFGLARSIDDVGLTQTGVVPGTPEYMSPEQARGEPLDHRTDLFSLGSVLYAMSAGDPPFQGSSTVAVLRKVSDAEPPALQRLNPSTPDWLVELIARLLAKAPAERIQSAAEVAALLEGYLAHLRQPNLPAPVLPALACTPSASGDPTMLLFACSACGTKVKARPDLAGKKVKCPHCGNVLTVPSEPPPPPPRVRSTLPFIAICALLGLVLLTICLRHLWAPGVTAKSLLEIDLGNQAVAGVEDSGFYHDEHDKAGPFRWTDGNAKLVIPLDRNDLPQALFVQLHRPKKTSLQITINGRVLVREPVTPERIDPWERTFDLTEIDLGESLVVEFVGNTVMPPNGDPRPLGVRVRAVRLLRERGTPAHAPLPSFLNVTLGTLTFPGVDDSGFHLAEERTNKGEFRWTDGNANVIIPLKKSEPLPQALLVRLDRPRNRWVRITVNGHVLLDEKGVDRTLNWWERVLDLRGIELGDRVVVELASNMEVPREGNSGNPDPRALGLKVRAITLLPTAEQVTPPSIATFLNVTVGNHDVPGVEDWGFQDSEGNKDGLFRWTRGKAKLVIPLDPKQLPQAMHVQLGVPTSRGFRLVVNGFGLVNEGPNSQRPWLWQKTFNLVGLSLGQKLVIEIESNTEPALFQPNGKLDARELGVCVRGIRLLRGEVGKSSRGP